MCHQQPLFFLHRFTFKVPHVFVPESTKHSCVILATVLLFQEHSLLSHQCHGLLLLTTHYTQVAAHIFEAIKSSFPPEKVVAKKPFLSMQTLHKAFEVRSLKQQIRALRTFQAAGDFLMSQ